MESSAQRMQALLPYLAVRPIDDKRFCGESHDAGGGHVFGGQVVAQALSASDFTVDGMLAHSLHGYFILSGDSTTTIDYVVDRVREGRSFATRHVDAWQNDRRIFSMLVSYQKAEEGPVHQIEMPIDLPEPETLKEEYELRREAAKQLGSEDWGRYGRLRPVDLRPVAQIDPLLAGKQPPFRKYWIRIPLELPDDPRLHRRILAYSSDFSLMGTARLPHGFTSFTPGYRGASLDHAIWFHRTCRVDEWLLFDMDSPNAADARGFSRGQIFNRDGVLVASTAQESLMRYTPPTN
ncbi:MAG: acyl-CoA thioesterase II [Pseudomonadota bacterium]